MDIKPVVACSSVDTRASRPGSRPALLTLIAALWWWAALPMGTAIAALVLTPDTNMTSAGPGGGPFTPGAFNYTVENTGPGTVNWTASSTQSWVTITPSSGTLPAGTFEDITVFINTQALALPGPAHFALITIAGGGFSNARGLNLTVTPPANDLFANAARLTTPTARGTGTTIQATTEAGESVAARTLSDQGAGRTVWFEWIAPFSGRAAMTHAAPGRFTSIRTYSLPSWQDRTLGNLKWHGEGVGNAGGSQGFLAQAGFSYFYQFDDVAGASSGPVVIDFASPPHSPDLLAAILPYARSIQIGGGSAATAFATMINTGTAALSGCRPILPTGIPATLNFHRTNAQNQPVGTQNVAFTLNPGQSQSLVFAVVPNAEIRSLDIGVQFGCAPQLDFSPAASIPGLNTFLLNGRLVPGPDMVAIAATASNDGIVNLTGASRTGAFATAAINIGGPPASSTPIRVTVDDGGRGLPLTARLCQTNAQGACINPATPATSVQLSVVPNQTVTFSVFVTASTAIAFDPANKRLFLRLKTLDGGTVGATTVAVRTVP